MATPLELFDWLVRYLDIYLFYVYGTHVYIAQFACCEGDSCRTPVDDVAAVKELERADDLGGVEHGAVVLEPPQLLDVVHQVAAVVKLHHEKQVILTAHTSTVHAKMIRNKLHETLVDVIHDLWSRILTIRSPFCG